MLERHGKGRGADRHAPILAKLAGCSAKELALLVELMPPVRDRRPAQEGEHLLHPLPEAIAEKQQVALLILLDDVMKHLGFGVVDAWPVLLETLSDIIGAAQQTLEKRKDVHMEEPREGEDYRGGR